MLFIARFSNLTVTIRNALVKRGENEEGQTYTYVVRPQLDANFQSMKTTEAQRIIAVRMFTELNPSAPWGAVPYATDGIMGQEFGDLIMDTESYSGYNPAFNLSKYDTNTDIDYEAQEAFTEEERQALKTLVEDRLLTCSEINKDYVRLDEMLPKPWPAYNSALPAKKLVSMARDFGISMREIVEYEKTQDTPNAQIIAEAQLEVAREAAAAAEREALGAIIS